MGFGSVSNGGTTEAGIVGNCVDSPNRVMTELIGLTCADLKAMGKCDSSDELVASLMLKHCAASCTECIAPRMTYSSGSEMLPSDCK